MALRPAVRFRSRLCRARRSCCGRSSIAAAPPFRFCRCLRERETDLEQRDASGSLRSDEVDPVLRDKLHRAIDALPEIYRMTLIMHDIEGYTHIEIAQSLGVAEGTCKSRLSLARAKLRAALSGLAEELEL